MISSLPKSTLFFIAGGHGMVGSAICRQLRSQGFDHLLTPRHEELDCCNQQAVRRFMNQHRPHVVVISAARVGGIYANSTYPAEFLYENVMIASNLIHESYKAGVHHLLYLGSTCIYPKRANQPIQEESLLTGPLEPTNEAYALAKIVGVKLCRFYSSQYGRRFISAMPTNLYGYGDSYHPENSHVIPALIERFHRAKNENFKEVVIWGSGKPLREFLFVEDAANACLLLLDRYNSLEPINIGSDEEISIHDLAKLIAEVVGYKGSIRNDSCKPDGTLRKKTDCSRIRALGWNPQISLEEGLKRTYADFLKPEIRAYP